MTKILVGDCLKRLRELPSESVHCVITSPPYWGLRAYKGDSGMIGLEPTFDEHLENLVTVFREVKRVLRHDGCIFLNYGDAYAASSKGSGGINSFQEGNRGSFFDHDQRFDLGSLKPKDLMMMPARVAMALQADGWWIRSEIVWHKPNPMPESVTDRPTSAHEKVFLLSKSARYFYDAEAVRVPYNPSSLPRYNTPMQNVEIQNRQPGREREREDKEQSPNPNGANLRNVWTIATHSFKEAHFATFPPALVEPCIKAGCQENGTVLDPFSGAGTVGLVAQRMGRNAILCEISPEYAEMSRNRIKDDAPMFANVDVE